MSQPAAALLARLKGQRSSPVLPRLRSLLKSPEGRVLSASCTALPAGRLQSTWHTRLQISQAQGTRIDGLPELLIRLQQLPANRSIEMVGVVGASEAGNIFFDAKTNDLLGAVLVAMSDHTRAYFRGELTGSPLTVSSRKKRSTGAAAHCEDEAGPARGVHQGLARRSS
jgi:hypothetical protein